MPNRSLPDILAASKLCEGLTRQQIERLAQNGSMQCVQYRRNDILFWTEHPPEKLYMLIGGGIAMAKDTLGGKRSLSKSNETPGELIGEVRLFSPRKLLWEYAVALVDSTVLEMDSGVFLRQGAVDAEVQLVLLRNLVAIVVDKIDNLGQKVRVLSMPSARARIALYLLQIQDENHRMVLRTTREELADYLGMARPSLSRELGRMQVEGIIRIDGREVHILDQHAFDALVE